MYDSANGYVYVVNFNSSNVSVINGTDLVGTINVGTMNAGYWHEFPAYDSANGYVYLPTNDGNVSVISGTKIIALVRVGGPGASPLSATYDSGNGYIYVVNQRLCCGTGNLSVINGTALIGSVGLGTQPDPATYDAGNGLIYVANLYNSTVSVIDGTTLVGTVNVGGPASSHGNQPIATTYDNSNGYIYVTDSAPVSRGTYYSGNVSVISGTSVVGNVYVGLTPLPAVYDPGNGYIYVMSYGNGLGYVCTISGLTIIGCVPTGSGPRSASATEPVLATYDGGNGYIYVPNYNSSDVSIIAGTTFLGSVNVGNGPGVAIYDPGNDYIYVTNYESNTVSVIPSVYRVTFTETGLPSATDWWVNASAGLSGFSNTSTLTLSASTGRYGYGVACSVKTYSALGGSFAVNHSVVSTSVAFSPVTYRAAFAESGLPTGTGWWVNVSGGPSVFSSTVTLVFMESNGTFAYSASPIDKTFASPSGAMKINGAAVSIIVPFTRVTYSVTFAESGLAPGALWSVTFDGDADTGTSNSLAFMEANGTYAFTAGSVAGYDTSPRTGTVIVAGTAITRAIAFAVRPGSTYTVAFLETGLPSGASWSVSFNGVEKSGVGAILFAGISNGTYPFTIGAVPGYTAGPMAGTVSVNGPSASQSIGFRWSGQGPGTAPPTFFNLSPTEGDTVLGGVIIAVLVVTGALVLWRRRLRVPPSAGEPGVQPEKGLPPTPP